MIRHVLLFRFNEGVEQVTRDEAVARLEALGEQCPTVDGWSIGVNQANSPSAYDVAEVADFRDTEALDLYKAHPAHREFAQFMGEISTWSLVDYEFTPAQ